MAAVGRLQTLSIAGYCMPMQFCNASRPSKSVESKRDRPTQKIGVVHQKIRRVICRDGCFHVLRPPENPKPQYKYILYESWDTRSPSLGGIYVVRNGKLLQQYQCDDYADPNASLLESGIKKLLQQEEYESPRLF